MFPVNGGEKKGGRNSLSWYVERKKGGEGEKGAEERGENLGR